MFCEKYFVLLYSYLQKSCSVWKCAQIQYRIENTTEIKWEHHRKAVYFCNYFSWNIVILCNEFIQVVIWGFFFFFEFFSLSLTENTFTHSNQLVKPTFSDFIIDHFGWFELCGFDLHTKLYYWICCKIFLRKKNQHVSSKCVRCSFNRKIFANKNFILVKMFYNPKINGQKKITWKMWIKKTKNQASINLD